MRTERPMTMPKFNPVLCIVAVLAGAHAPSQGLPDEMYFSADGHQLLTGVEPVTGLYDESVVRSIYLTFPQANWWTLLTNNYSTQTDLPATMVVDGITYDSVGMRFRGQTSYMQLPPGSQKKSFNITLDYIHPNQDIMGYQTHNLNNCFQDESFMREVFYLHQIRKHIPAAKACFTKLYLNGSNWGVYPSVQQLNKDFLKEWWLTNDGTNWRADRPAGGGSPGWGDGTAALNYLGPDTASYQPHYTLKSYTKSNPWDDLVNTADVLNNTPLADLDSLLPVVLNVDRTLWFLACENLCSDDDSYIHKGRMDYYVHYEIETGRMCPQEYDGNSVMDPSRQTWSPFYNESNPNYPLMNRMFAVPEWRQRYLAHMRTLIKEVYNQASADSLIDSYKALIDTMVQNDPKKLYTYTQFNNEITVLKNFITGRRNYLNAHGEIAQPAPAISNVAEFVNGVKYAQPEAMQGVDVRATVTSTNGIDHVYLYYAASITGNFSRTPMYDDGAHDDGGAGDGVFGASIPGQAGGVLVRYYVEAVAANPAKTAAYSPPGAEHNVYVYITTLEQASEKPVVINELMASNQTTAADSAGEYDDWIELYNTTGSDVDLTGWSLTDNDYNFTKWQFPSGTMIPSGGYLIVWADEDGGQGALHASFKLSGSGEQLTLLNSSGELVDQTTLGQQTADMGYSRVPNGTGPFIIQSATFAASNDLTSAAELSAPITLNIYPNPATDYIEVEITSPQLLPLEVFNALGQLVASYPATRSLRISVGGWSSGVYVVRCGSAVRKVVVGK